MIKKRKKNLCLFSTKLKISGEWNRFECTTLILQQIEIMCGDNPFVSGNFNVDQKSKLYHFLVNSKILQYSYTLANTRRTTGATFTMSTTSGNRVDPVFINDKLHVAHTGYLRNLHRRHCRESMPSDHYPVEIKISFKS